MQNILELNQSIIEMISKWSRQNLKRDLENN
jgi:hypothetical protein